MNAAALVPRPVINHRTKKTKPAEGVEEYVRTHS